MSFKTITSSYLKKTFLKLTLCGPVRSSTGLACSLISDSFSMMSKTLSEAANPCWIALFKPLNFLTGSYSIRTAAINEKKVPGVESPEITFEPPYHMIKAIPNPPRNSIMGEDKDLAITDFISSLKRLKDFSWKRFFSYDSIPKAFTILLPANVSCKKEFRFAIDSWQPVLILRTRLPNSTTGINAMGKTTNASRAIFQSR